MPLPCCRRSLHCLQSTFYATSRQFFLPVFGGAPSSPQAMQRYEALLREQLRIFEAQLQKTGGCRGAGAWQCHCVTPLHSLQPAVLLTICLPCFKLGIGPLSSALYDIGILS